MKTELLYGIFKESKGVATDSRTVKRGELFFALWGENYNGNKFAAEALEKGASYAVIDDPLFEDEKTILVDDCLFELQALASYYRKSLNILKDMLMRRNQFFNNRFIKSIYFNDFIYSTWTNKSSIQLFNYVCSNEYKFHFFFEKL